MAGFAVAVNNGSAEPRYYVDHLHRQRVQLQQQHHHQQEQQQPPRYQVQVLAGHVVPALAKEVLEPPSRRNDLVYVHCATTEDEEAEDEEEESKGLTRSRSWLCCPGDRRADKTVPIQVEADGKDKQYAVSSRLSFFDSRGGSVTEMQRSGIIRNLRFAGLIDVSFINRKSLNSGDWCTSIFKWRLLISVIDSKRFSR